MNLTDIQVELRNLERTVGEQSAALAKTVEERIATLHSELEKLKPRDTPKLDIDFARITSVAARNPLVKEQLRGVQMITQKSFFAALAYLIALDSEAIEDKLYYLCRLAKGCNYQVTAEELLRLGLAYSPQDWDSLGQYLGGLKECFMVEALVLANFAGPASREVLGALATLADRLDIGGERMGELGQVAQARLCSGQEFATIEQARFWSVLFNCRVGDTFAFGHYPQGANGEVQPIEWQVLRRDTDGLLVIAKYALDCKPYNEVECDVTWSQCTLRKWLNSEFLDKAFTATVRQQITQVHLRNPNNCWYIPGPGDPDTDDRIFLLSRDEAEQLFANNESRQCLATAYAKQNNATTTDDGLCWWWLRSPGINADCAASVDYFGAFGSDSVYRDFNAVRPAFKIAL